MLGRGKTILSVP